MKSTKIHQNKNYYHKIKNNSNKYYFTMPSLFLSIIPILCALCTTFCNASPIDFPCCPGSQHVIAVMAKHIGTFSAVDAQQNQSMICKTAATAVQKMQDELQSISGSCSNNGGTKLVEQMHQQLTIRELLKMEITYEDECFFHLSFARAMFDLAKISAAHAGKGAEWRTLQSKFEGEQRAIEVIGRHLNIEVGDVQFAYPSCKGNSAHENVPSPSDVIATPGKLSSVGGQKGF